MSFLPTWDTEQRGHLVELIAPLKTQNPQKLETDWRTWLDNMSQGTMHILVQTV